MTFLKKHVLGALPQTPKFLRHFEYRESQRKSQMFHWLSRSFTQNIPYQFVLPHSLIPLLSGMDNMPHENHFSRRSARFLIILPRLRKNFFDNFYVGTLTNNTSDAILQLFLCTSMRVRQLRFSSFSASLRYLPKTDQKWTKRQMKVYKNVIIGDF